jgi:glutathione S-transferase
MLAGGIGRAAETATRDASVVMSHLIGYGSDRSPKREGKKMIGAPISEDSLTLYGSFTSSSSYKPMLYLALAGLPFSFRTVNLKIGVQSTPEYLAINRWGVVPSLRHRGLTILQSNVILDYLARETGHFEGRTEQERWQAREWLSWEADHITAVARVRHSARFRRMHDEVIAEFRPRAEAALSFVDRTVRDRPFLVGDKCTIADIGCWGRMVFMAEGGFEIGHWLHLEAWADRLKAMPGFALPYDLIPSKDREFPAAPHYSRGTITAIDGSERGAR